MLGLPELAKYFLMASGRQPGGTLLKHIHPPNVRRLGESRGMQRSAKPSAHAHMRCTVTTLGEPTLGRGLLPMK